MSQMKLRQIKEKIKEVNSKIFHPWDIAFVVDLEKIGKGPGIKNPKVTPQNCNKDQLFALIFSRLETLEPLFCTASPYFKEKFQTACVYAFYDCLNKKNKKLYSLNWAIFFNTFQNQMNFIKIFTSFNMWEEQCDNILWNKIDFSKFLDQEYRLHLGENYKKDLLELTTGNYSAQFGKIIESAKFLPKKY